MTFLCCLDAMLQSAPAVYGGTLIDLALQDFVPSHDAASLGVDKLLYAVGEISLHIAGVESLALHQFLTLRTLCGAYLRSLVTTDVYDFRWEDVDDFREHILAKLVYLLVAEAEDVVIYAPVLAHLIRTARATQFWIAGECRLLVSGHIYFRYDGHMTLACIFHHFLCLLLSVVAAVRLSVIDLRVMTKSGLGAHAALGREFGIFLYLYSPPLVF